MKFRILQSVTVIGESDFENLDPSTGIAHGVFLPSVNYASVQPVFRLYATAGTNIVNQDATRLNEYYTARDALGLSLSTAEGEHVPTDCIHIIDYLDEIGEIEVMVIAADADTFERFFETES